MYVFYEWEEKWILFILFLKKKIFYNDFIEVRKWYFFEMKGDFLLIYFCVVLDILDLCEFNL